MRSPHARRALVSILAMASALLIILPSTGAQPRIMPGTGSPNTSSAATPMTPPAYAVQLPVVIRDSAGLPPTSTSTTTPMPTLTATPSPIPPALTPTTTPAPISDPVLVGAGDISSCYIGNVNDEATAKLLDVITGTVFTSGDNAYPDGTLDQYNNCYDPTWGRHKARTHPAVGNHEYHTPGAAGYFTYFGAAAGDPTKGYYSYDLGAWHIVVINSNCIFIGGCQAGSPQEQWLRADLAAHPAACTLGYWHHPRFTSSFHGNDLEMQPIWQALYEASADLVINGHAHMYERFAPQDPTGALDLVHGIREIVVGTGGDKFTIPVSGVQPNSEVLNETTHGVLKLTLHPTSYDWEFIPVAGQTFTDAGSGTCHTAGLRGSRSPGQFVAAAYVQSSLVCGLLSATGDLLYRDEYAPQDQPGKVPPPQV